MAFMKRILYAVSHNQAEARLTGCIATGIKNQAKVFIKTKEKFKNGIFKGR
jgi:hypothetical protein